MKMKWFRSEVDGDLWVEVSYSGWLYNVFPGHVWKQHGGYVIAHIRALMEVERTGQPAQIRY